MKIALIGCGTVGQAVLQILNQNSLKTFEISKILVNNITKSRKYVPENCLVTDNLSDITTDDHIDCIIEVMGGNTLAKEIIFKTLHNGKKVITANKEPMCKLTSIDRP